ncbi:cleft lip and palate transmembrane protein 1-domain-containing protein [Gigaspora rosea]|uniref:Cleft lip and palate transmembrane protein 1-domain-containing protein n=1 Tax=Gigaspora rosea TaxID=44941 RepID=A0A397VWJ2_9GLOM|nr:cleft lip and palate transmembrane protein 1-domain-containing protein [Gigaspora rosea]
MSSPADTQPEASTSGDQTSNNSQRQSDGQENVPPQQPQQPQRPSAFQVITQTIFHMLLAYYIMNFFFKGSTDIPSPPAIKLSSNDVPQNENVYIKQLFPSWPLESSMDLRVYISEDETFTKFNDPSVPKWHTSNILFGDWEDEREMSFEIPTSKAVRNNGSLYAHIFLTLGKASPDPLTPGFQDNMRVYSRKLLTRYYPKRKIVKTKNLILGSNDDENEVDEINETKVDDKVPIVSYWSRNLTLNIVSDNGIIPYAKLPPSIASTIPFDTSRLPDSTTNSGWYLPIVFVNDFWILRDHLTLINETVKTLPINIKYYPLSFMKFQLYMQMDESFRKQAQMIGGDAHSEFDEIKRMLKETNPILLGVTFIVSLLHSVFEFLAFKNDISHWRKKDEMTGVSVRSILLNIFFQVVILLYLFDNNADTSWMILIGQGVSVAIEVWKIKKAVGIEIKSSQGASYLPYTIKFIDRHKLSESEERTKEYDRLAFRYLSRVAYPLLFCYAIYSLVYNSHKSWYSFILATLVGFVYAFGFIMMTPQLFINYKLKSVAHMPWKTLMYKTLGTFVDDLFAFCIKMPTLHRLACLRDDVVFFVYLYQRWVYPTDNKRANEYGQVDESNDKENDERMENENDEQMESKKDR